MQGAQLIKNNLLDVAICGGSEALSKFTINGFNSLMIVDPEHCRPFDNTRKGLNLGEGAAYLVLESEESVIRKNKTPIAELKGYGNANDAFHQTASSPEGTGALNAMKLALRAQIFLHRILIISMLTVRLLKTMTCRKALAFKDYLVRKSRTSAQQNRIPVIRWRQQEVLKQCIACLALQHQMIWPNLNFQHQMPELSITPVKELKQQVRLKKHSVQLLRIRRQYIFTTSCVGLIMEEMKCYINGIGIISPQRTFDQ